MARSKAQVRDILSDPLSTITRKERRNLLLASTVGLCISWTGLVPTEISTLGIELSFAEQRNFLYLLSAIIVYFFLAFVTYGLADYFVYREARRNYDISVETEILNATPPELQHPDDPEELVPHISWVYSWSRPLAQVRHFLEYGIPLVLCLLSILMLLFHA